MAVRGRWAAEAGRIFAAVHSRKSFINHTVRTIAIIGQTIIRSSKSFCPIGTYSDVLSGCGIIFAMKRVEFIEKDSAAFLICQTLLLENLFGPATSSRLPEAPPLLPLFSFSQ